MSPSEIQLEALLVIFAVAGEEGISAPLVARTLRDFLLRTSREGLRQVYDGIVGPPYVQI